VSPQQILTTVMTRIFVDKSKDHAKQHFGLFFTTTSTSKEMFLFFLKRELKKALRDTLTRAALPGILSTTAKKCVRTIAPERG